MMTQRYKILQITPANPGWWANYRMDAEDGGGVERAAVACWALVEWRDPHGTITAIDGVDPAGEGNSCLPCSETSNFSHYSYDPSPASAPAGTAPGEDATGSTRCD